MARGKVVTTKELTEQNIILNKKLDTVNKSKSQILEKIGGLRAHMVQNTVSNEQVLNILEQIIQDS